METEAAAALRRRAAQRLTQSKEMRHRKEQDEHAWYVGIHEARTAKYAALASVGHPRCLERVKEVTHSLRSSIDLPVVVRWHGEQSAAVTAPAPRGPANPDWAMTVVPQLSLDSAILLSQSPDVSLVDGDELDDV